MNQISTDIWVQEVSFLINTLQTNTNL